VLPPGGTPHFNAVLATPAGGAFQLTVVHPMPPISPTDRQARDDLFAQLGAAPPGSAVARVMMGDFNTTPWSAGLRRLHSAGWARASGLVPTYSLLRSLPIDHILATRAHWRVAAAGVGPWLGSDHKPVWAVLRPLPPPAP
jgi:endonuclease/exonuclease/phosphatase (EEP) superfamily protein YafD